MKRKGSTFWLSVLAMSIVLIFLYSFGLLTYQSSKIEDALKRNIPLVVELEEDVRATDIDAIKTYIQNLEEYQNSSLAEYDEDFAFELMQKDFGLINEDSLKNPFVKVLTFRVTAPYFYEERLQSIKLNIEKIKGTSTLVYQNVAFDELHEQIDRFRFIVFCLALFFSFLAVFLIHNSFQLVLLSDRQTIKTMVLVGARPEFIKLPYLRRGFFIGVLSFLFSLMVIIGLILFLSFEVSILDDVLFGRNFFVIGAIVLMIAIMLPMISTYIIVSLYLKQNTNLEI